MNPNQKREVPHHHECTVVKHLIGCDNPHCSVEYYTVCREPEHIAIYKAATVHLMPVDGVLPCCGKVEAATAVGDRKAYDPRLVTCPGLAQQLPVNSAVHDPFGAEAQEQSHAAAMTGPGVID